jgi:hypothetical protein
MTSVSFAAKAPSNPCHAWQSPLRTAPREAPYCKPILPDCLHLSFRLPPRHITFITPLLHLTPLCQNRLQILHGGTIASMVDLGGSLAVASRGLYSTGVSTDISVTYLSSGGKIGDLIRAEVSCDKCTSPFLLLLLLLLLLLRHHHLLLHLRLPLYCCFLPSSQYGLDNLGY